MAERDPTEARELLADLRECGEHPLDYGQETHGELHINALAALEQAGREIEAAKLELRDFEHIEGEPLSETAAVAAQSFAFAKHRADSTGRALEQEREELRRTRQMLGAAAMVLGPEGMKSVYAMVRQQDAEEATLASSSAASPEEKT